MEKIEKKDSFSVIITLEPITITRTISELQNELEEAKRMLIEKQGRCTRETVDAHKEVKNSQLRLDKAKNLLGF
jgi:hypothetical protein